MAAFDPAAYLATKPAPYAAFDPAAYLATKPAPYAAFDPAAYLAQKAGGFDPDAYLTQKPEEEGFFTGMGKSIYGGARDTGGSLYSAGATAVGANQAVVESAQAAAARSPEQARALQAYLADIQKRKQAGDEGLWAGIKNVAGATADNPEGALQMVVSQLPNTAVALGTGAAGAAIGSVVPGIGTAIGGTVGFLVGLFSANTALELGSKAQEKARDGKFTDAERYEAMKEGVVKGATITAVDAATFGASKWLMGTANRAVETATVRTIEGAGVDATKAVTSIKTAQAKALEASAGLSKAETTAAVEKATVEAMAREGLTDPALVASIRQAQAKALEGVNTIAKKAGRGASAMGLETTGEGLGEYLGEYAATGEASPTEAVMEALAGLSMSVAELHGATRLDKPGALTGGTNAYFNQLLSDEKENLIEQLTAQLGRPPTEEEFNAELNRTYSELSSDSEQPSTTPAGSAKVTQTQGPISEVSTYTDANLVQTLQLQLAKPQDKQNQPLIKAIQAEIQKRAATQGEQNAGQTIAEPSGVGVPVAGQSDPNAPAGGTGIAEPSGVVSTRQDVAGTPERAPAQPVAVDPKQKRIEELTQELIDVGFTPQNARQNAEEKVNNETQADEEYETTPAESVEKERIVMSAAPSLTKDEFGNTTTQIELSNGSKYKIQRLNSAESMGLPGWHDTGATVTTGSFLGNTKSEAIEELIRREQEAPSAIEEQQAPAEEQQAPAAEPVKEVDQAQANAQIETFGVTGKNGDTADHIREEWVVPNTNELFSEYDYFAGDASGRLAEPHRNLQRIENLEDLAKAEAEGKRFFIAEKPKKLTTDELRTEIRSLEEERNKLLSKNGREPAKGTKKRVQWDAISDKMSKLAKDWRETAKEELAQNGPTDETPSVLPAREEPLPHLAGMHSTTVAAIQKNDITGALKALARNTSGFFSDLAKRLAELKLQAGISFNNERNLVRRAIDLKTTPQQKRLFTYISLWYPLQYDMYFKNYDREENLEKVFRGLKVINKLNLGPVIGEYNDVVYKYEKNIPALTAPGAYFPEFNEITISTHSPFRAPRAGNRVMLHEVVHGATVALLAKDFRKLNPAQQEAVQALRDMYIYAKKILPPGHYGMTNIYEFVSEVFTNKKFQDRLKVIPYKLEGQKGGLLNAFVQKILALFGMNNLASSAMVQAEKLFSAEAPSVTIPSGPKLAKKNRGPISTPNTSRTAESVARTYMDVVNDMLHNGLPWSEARKEMFPVIWSAGGGNVRKGVLGFLNLRQLADLTATKFPQLTSAIKVIGEMLAYRSTKLKIAEGITSKWIAAQRKDPQMSSLMCRIMLEATIRGIDPDTFVGPSEHIKLQKAWNTLDLNFQEIYREVRNFYADSVKDMVDMLKERAKAHGTPTEIAKRLEDIDAQFGPDKLLKPYFPLRRFGDYYFQIGTGDYKEFYTFEQRSTRDLTMNKRTKELAAGNKQQQKLAENVYAGNSTSELFSSMSTTKVIQNAQKLIDSLGNSIEDSLKKNPGAVSTADAQKYIVELKDEMRDALNQLLYITLPQTSMRKMFINRKSVQGASEDMLRVFATTAVHSAYQQSRLKYAEKFLGNLIAARDHISLFSKEKQAIYDDYIKEVAARAKTILSTEDTSTTAKVAGWLSESTFYYMLSAPFTAMLNIIGATTIAMPYIGARYGYAKANALMLKNLGKYTATAPTRTFAPMASGKFLEVQFPSIVEGSKLSPILQRAADLFVAEDDITISSINDINNLSEHPTGLYTGNYNNVKKVLSGLFHQSERLNREVVLMTTFELAYEKFKSADKTDLQGVIERDKTTGQPIKYTEEEAFTEAIAEAREIAGQTLGDFSRQMKPRYFTPPILGLVFKFKQYAVLATYIVLRNLYLSIGAPFSKNELKEFRAQLEEKYATAPDKNALIKQHMGEIEAHRQELYWEARRRLAGILGITFLYGGIEAMPFFSLGGVGQSGLGLIVSMFAGGGDDEDPDLLDWESWFRNYMQETFGGATGAILARGLGTAVTGGALSERVSLDFKNLWYRDGRFSPDTREGFINTAIANSGPVVGLGFNLVDAYSLADEGQLDRAFEKLLPAIASKPLIATRIATEEGRTRRGVKLAEDFSAWEIAIQAIGLQPERFAIAQKNAIDAKLHEQKALAEKNAILNRLWMERDSDEYEDILDKASAFSALHPVLAITGRTIQDSFKERTENQAIAEILGVQLSNPKMIAEVESKLQYKPYSVFGKNE